jgi:pimeloyl-ACP methyl ester carboxylesterase
MRVEYHIIKTAKLLLLAALFMISAFLFPPEAKTDLTLPITGCEAQQENFVIYGASQHITSDMNRENGLTAFAYGLDNNSFVSQVDNKILFNVKLLFSTEELSSIVKLYAFDRSCNPVFGFGPVFYNLNSDSLNTIEFDKDTYEVSLNGEAQQSRPLSAINYMWVEVWNGKSGGDKKASYSYLVDVNNLQNPTGQVDDDTEPLGKRPVIIIPGIMGSELYNDAEHIWVNTSKIAFSQSDNFIYDNLKLDENGVSVNSILAGDIVKRIGYDFYNIDIFHDLIDKLERANYSYFFFPYDWRIDIDNIKSRLNYKINSVKQETGFKKVDIIIHSMGGLVVQSYLKEYGSNDIDKIIFVGTPHLGAPKAAKALLFGDIDIGFGVVNWGTIKELSLNSPSVYQLLPSLDYVSYGLEYLELANNDTLEFEVLDYLQSLQYLKNKNLNSKLIDDAVSFQSTINDYETGDIDLYNIVGCKMPTAGRFQIDDNRSGIFSTKYITGDGTVPLKSATYVSVPDGHEFYVKNGGHSALPSLENVRNLIVDILSDNVGTYPGIRNDSNDCALKGRQYEWHSPVEIHIYDSLGNHAGPTLSGFENNIPGISYDIINGEKFIYIPDDGQVYRIEGVGEGTGTFDLKIITYDNDDIIQTEVFNDIPVTAETIIKIEPESSNTLNYDYTGSGTFDSVEPNSTLTSNFDDHIPPSTDITKLIYDETAEVTLSAADNESGLLEIKYSVDNGDYQIYNNMFFVRGDGSHSVRYYAIDKAGNNEVVKEDTFLLHRHSSSSYVPPVEESGQVLGEVITKPTESATIIRDGFLFYFLENNTKRLFRTYDELFTYVGGIDEIPEAGKEQLSLPNGSWMPAKKGSLILDTRDNKTVYIVDNNNELTGFASEQAFLSLGYNFKNIIKLNIEDYIINGVIE